MIFSATLLKKIDASLLFNDTDGLTYEIKSKDIYEEFLNTNTCLTIANITQIFLIQLTKTLLAK